MYADQDVAERDARLLRRRAAVTGARAEVDCLPIPVLTASQHERGQT